MRLRLWQKTYAVAAVPLVFGSVFFASLWLIIDDVHRASEREQKARTALYANERFISGLVGTATELYEYSRSHDPDALQRFKDERAKMSRLRTEMWAASKGWLASEAEWQSNEVQLEKLFKYADEMADMMPKYKNPLVQLKMARVSSEMLPQLQETRELWEEFRLRIAKEVREAESGLKGRAAFVRLFVLAGVAACGLVTFVATVLLQRSVVSRLTELSRSADSLLRLEKPSVTVSGSDEIADLQVAYQAMANEILEARKRERAIIDHATDVLFTLDSDGKISHLSPSAESVWRQPVSSLLGASLACELREGTTEVELFGVPMRVSARKAGSELVCVAHDASYMVAREAELREREERIRVIVESMPAGLLVMTSDFEIVRANGKAGELLSFTSSTPVNEIFSIGPTEEFSGRIVQRSVTLPDGTSRWVELSMHKFVEKDAELILLIFLDTTEKQEVKLMRDRLVAMIAHDIGTPLSSIQTVLKLLSMGVYGQLDDAGVKQVQVAEEETKRLMSTFKDLLAIQRRLQVDS